MSKPSDEELASLERHRREEVHRKSIRDHKQNFQALEEVEVEKFQRESRRKRKLKLKLQALVENTRRAMASTTPAKPIAKPPPSKPSDKKSTSTPTADKASAKKRSAPDAAKVPDTPRKKAKVTAQGVTSESSSRVEKSRAAKTNAAKVIKNGSDAVDNVVDDDYDPRSQQSLKTASATASDAPRSHKRKTVSQSSAAKVDEVGKAMVDKIPISERYNNSVNIIVGYDTVQVFPLPKAILLQHSPYARQHFADDSASSDIKIADCEPSTFSHFLHFVYTGTLDAPAQPKLEASFATLINVHFLAVKLRVSGLANLALDNLHNLSKSSEHYLDAANVLLIYKNPTAHAKLKEWALHQWVDWAELEDPGWEVLRKKGQDFIFSLARALKKVDGKKTKRKSIDYYVELQ